MQEQERSKPKQYDIDGYDVITNALKDLLNQYPGLLEWEHIEFSTLSEDSGISFHPTAGAVVIDERNSITGKVNQLCGYPFLVLYRTSATSSDSKIDVKEFLDNLGRWLEKQTVEIEGKSYKLDEYPHLTNERTVEGIARQSPAYLDAVYENDVQDWAISILLKYRNIFYRNK